MTNIKSREENTMLSIEKMCKFKFGKNIQLNFDVDFVNFTFVTILIIIIRMKK